MQYHAVALGFLLCVGIVTMTMFYLLSPREEDSYHSNHNSGRQPLRLPSPTNSWTQNNGDTRRRRKKPSPTDQTTCAICFEAVISEIKTLPCQHKFHFQCITKWIQENRSCPLCRTHSTM